MLLEHSISHRVADVIRHVSDKLDRGPAAYASGVDNGDGLEKSKPGLSEHREKQWCPINIVHLFEYRTW